MARYRIIPDRFSGWEVQVKRWWFPFWVQPGTNTFTTLAEAKAHAEHLAKSPLYLNKEDSSDE